MKVAAPSADLLIKLALLAGGIGAAWYLYKQASQKLNGVTNTIENVYQSVADTANEVADAVIVGTNPANPENWINRAATAGVNAIAGNEQSIGGRIYDWFNPDPVDVAREARADYALTDPRRVDNNNSLMAAKSIGIRWGVW